MNMLPDRMYGEAYDIEFSLGNCSDCNREKYIGKFKLRDKGVIMDIWLCQKCYKKLENRIKREWKNKENIKQ